MVKQYLICYEDYKKLILKKVWQVMSYYNINSSYVYDELLAEGNLIFVESLLTFDYTKNINFSVYLYNNLRALEYFVKKEFFGKAMYDSDFYVYSYELQMNIKDYLYFMIDNEKEKEILDYIFNYEWKEQNRRNLYYNKLYQEFISNRGWSRKEFLFYFNKIKEKYKSF